MRRWILPVIVAVAACAKSKPGQSYRDAVDIVCHVDDAPGFATASPAERPAIMSRWAEEKVTNAEGLALIEALGGAGGLDRRKMLAEAKAKAGLDTCPVFDVLAPWPVPEVGTAQLESLDARATIVITEGKLMLSGDTEVALDALAEQIQPLADLRPGSLTLILDPETPYRVVFDVMSTVKASYHRFALVASADGGRGIVPIVLPDTASVRPDDPAEPLEQMVVGLSEDTITLFSLSGAEGTLAQPALRVALTEPAEARAKLQETLGEIVERRWTGRTRTAASRRITLMASEDVTAAVFVPVMAAVRRAGEAELYTDVILGTSVIEQIEAARDAHGAFAEVQVSVNLDSSLTGELVATKIEREHLAAIKRCVNDGTVKLVFTVKRNGKTVDARAELGAELDDAARAGCLTSLIKGWRFPPAVDADGDSREPEVTVTLRLRQPEPDTVAP